MNEKNTKQEKNEVKKNETSEISAVEIMQKQINEQINKFNLLQQKLNHRNKFLSTKEKLSFVDKTLIDHEEKGDFESDQVTLIISGKINGYREEDVMKISSVPVIREVIIFIGEKIDKKVEELERQIIAA